MKELEEINDLAVKAYGLDKAIEKAKEALQNAVKNVELRRELLKVLEQRKSEHSKTI